jgi:hypothetical protein
VWIYCERFVQPGKCNATAVSSRSSQVCLWFPRSAKEKRSAKELNELESAKELVERGFDVVAVLLEEC